MKEYIEKKLKERRLSEQQLVEQIRQGEQQLSNMKASLISIRGGIIELSELLKKFVKEATEEEE